jgi:3-methylcrotonyl-CoA carboxylase beta subunit
MKSQSSVDVSSTDFARNSEVMRSLVAELRDKLNLVSGGSGKTSRARHTARGEMLARERVDYPVDDPDGRSLVLQPVARADLNDVEALKIILYKRKIIGMMTCRVGGV